METSDRAGETKKGRGFAYLPEAASFLIGFAAAWWYLEVWHAPFTGAWEGMVRWLLLAASLLSACFYMLASRPRMYLHWPVQVSACMVAMLVYYLELGSWRPPRDLYEVLMIPLAFLFVFAAIARFTLIPVLLVCGGYHYLYAKLSGKNPGGGSA